MFVCVTSMETQIDRSLKLSKHKADLKHPKQNRWTPRTLKTPKLAAAWTSVDKHDNCIKVNGPSRRDKPDKLDSFALPSPCTKSL